MTAPDRLFVLALGGLALTGWGLLVDSPAMVGGGALLVLVCSGLGLGQSE